MDFNDSSNGSMVGEIRKNAVALPKLLTILHSPKLVSAQPDAPVWIRVFPRNPAPAPALACETWRNVVFGKLNVSDDGRPRQRKSASTARFAQSAASFEGWAR
jgi:hypothetical protein